MIDEVDEVWDNVFDNHFNLAAEKLLKSCPEPEHPIEFDEFLNRLKVHFLFPNLNDQERDVVWQMACERHLLQSHVTALAVQRHVMSDEVVAGRASFFL